MKFYLMALTIALATASTASAETRCGWISNPTPANYWIDDADGQWIIGVQGGYQAEGDITEYPTDDQMVNTNGNYGYWCGCIGGRFDSRNKKVLKITSSSVKSLDKCLEDGNLQTP